MAAKIMVPDPEASRVAVPVASPSVKGKKTEMEPMSRATSSDHASQRRGKKKEKIPTPEVRELESEEESAAEEATELEEEEVPSTPEPDPKPKDWETRSSSKKKPGRFIGALSSLSANLRHQQRGKARPRNREASR